MPLESKIKFYVHSQKHSKYVNCTEDERHIFEQKDLSLLSVK